MTLVDTSVWIDGFRGGESKEVLKKLIDNGSICINDIILAELLPSIRKRGETELENLLNLLPKVPIQIDWNGLIYMQTENLKHGINKVGLPDLMIAQNVLQNGLTLFSLDRHFELIGNLLPLQLYK
ncbi:MULTISPECIES: PIN domain-containing protein [unclassified Fibrobacter]|jgi:predicted nucleic acid-binding protein|uniref:PIN domain-containing protein n=1 Tax=unclassified Fibrobacter TaxID=2634177 RepID=UPI0015658C8B|nr:MULTISPECIES: PIN domain-containing protein [unclassified Fibrobacter]